ncbi:MAG: T9SS type A sorting domain-containing protein [Flavobacteriales bacterium]|nr:T9SS type A sorting domain-containing protein [Flavobacteriales bacterium]
MNIITLKSATKPYISRYFHILYRQQMSGNFNLTLSLVVLLAVFFSANLQAQNALNFDGANDYVQTSFSGVLGTANRTFEAWVNVDANASGNVCVVDYGTNSVGSRNSFSVSGSNGLTFISGGTNANIGSTSNVVTPGQWTHVAFVLDNGTGYLYVNGTQVGTGNLSTVNTPSGNTNLRIGQRVAGGSIPFYGSIDEVRIWDYARSVTEISNGMGAEYCTLDSNLGAYHKFNHGTAGGSNSGVNSSYDASGNGNNGSLQNISLSGATSNWVTGYGLSTSSLAGTLSATGCNASYTSPSGNHVWTQAGTYTDTIQSVMACDSILTITLAFNTSTASSIVESVCESYTSPSGSYTWTVSGIYTDTLVNAAGCDSILTVDLSVNNSSSEFSVDACNSYTIPSGNNTYIFSGSYFDTIPNAAGCDSSMLIHVTILQNSSSSITASGCNGYTSPSGLYYWTESGTYIDTATAANGCDSMITVNLTIDTVNAGISKSGKTLSATAVGASYQWMKCSDSTLVSGEAGKTYSPNKTGWYAVIVTQNGCTDTSECLKVNIVGVEDYASDLGISVFPNPTSGMVTIDGGFNYENSQARIINAEGKTVRMIEKFSSRQIQFELGATGLYTVLIYAEGGYRAVRVMKTE